MSVPREVIAKFGGGDNRVITNVFYLMKEVGVSYTEFLEMPIPTIMALTEELSRHNKREADAMKKRR